MTRHFSLVYIEAILLIIAAMAVYEDSPTVLDVTLRSVERAQRAYDWSIELL